MKYGCPGELVTCWNQPTRCHLNQGQTVQSNSWTAASLRRQILKGVGSVAVLGSKTWRKSNQPNSSMITSSIHWDPKQIQHDLIEIRRDVVQILQDPVRSWRIKPDINQISTNPTKSQPRWRNPKPTGTTWNPKRPKPANPTRIPSQFQVLILSARKYQVDSGLGTNLTRPNL